MNSNNRIAATLYSVGTLFVSGNVSINTLHEGDDDDDNDNIRVTANGLSPGGSGYYACT